MEYRVVCVKTEHDHRHILSVGTGPSAERWSRIWSVEEVWQALETGNRFYTIGPSTARAAEVRADLCRIGGCTVKTLRSTPDAVPDNNLQSMPGCSV